MLGAQAASLQSTAKHCKALQSIEVKPNRDPACSLTVRLAKPMAGPQRPLQPINWLKLPEMKRN